MFVVIVMAVALTVMLCGFAYTLATYALPFMLALAAARFAYATGAGIVGAAMVGLAAGTAAFAILATLFAAARAPILRVALGAIFAAPAAVAGYALVHGVTHDAVPSEIWRQIFCIAGGACVGLSALARLSNPP